jgi:hypothetical protein
MVQPKYSPEEVLERVKLMMKYDLSKTSVENKKVVSEQTQSSTPDPLSCIKNYFQTKTYFYYKGAKFNRNSITGISEMEVTLNSKLIWKFFSGNNGNRTWKQFSEGTLTDEGSWSCDGDSNFTMKSNSGKLNFDSKNSEEFFKQIQSGGQPTQTQPVAQPTQAQPVAQPTQVQPVAQPTQIGPAAGYTDANQQSTLRRQDSILSDILDNQSVNKSVCRKNITSFYKSFKQKNSIVVDPATIAKAKRIVQACRDQHYGKFGMLGMLDSGREKGPDGEKINIDDMLDILSGRKEGGPLTQGSDSMWRIK